jgi:predicted CopG family antitoxin
MAVKTITIDLEAYEALARRKRKGESFSRVIKEYFGRRSTGRDLTALLPEICLSDSTLRQLDGLVRGRRRDRARAPKLRSTSTPPISSIC